MQISNACSCEDYCINNSHHHMSNFLDSILKKPHFFSVTGNYFFTKNSDDVIATRNGRDRFCQLQLALNILVKKHMMVVSFKGVRIILS